MKTNFETPEDIYCLEKILTVASMHTEIIFEPVYNTEPLIGYRDVMIDLRAKIYEFLGQEDPNEEVIKQLKKKESSKGFN